MFPGPATRIPGWKGELAHLSHKDFFYELQVLAAEFTKYQTTQERPGSGPVPGIDWVRLKVIKRKWSEPRFTGPYRVVERTSHAVRLQRKRRHRVPLESVHSSWGATTHGTRRTGESTVSTCRPICRHIPTRRRICSSSRSVAGIPAKTTSFSWITRLKRPGQAQ